jgi:hypothetical protein
VAAVDDFMADVDRRPVFFEGKIDNVDGPIDTGAKAARVGEIDRKVPSTE